MARDGFGDMAVSNAIGSNVFDINLGLGLPFLIRILIDKGKAMSLLGPEQKVSSIMKYASLKNYKVTKLQSLYNRIIVVDCITVVA